MIRRLIAVFVIVLAPSTAMAQSCSFNISSVSFANLDTLSSTPTDITATVAVSCSGTPLTTVRICPSIGAGSGGATSSARQMASGASTLAYQLYQDPGRTLVWGSYNWALPGTPPTIDLPLALNGTGSANLTIYARAFGGQGTVAPGNYATSFSAADTDFMYATTLGILPCPNVIALPQHAHPVFTGSATFVPRILVMPRLVATTSTGAMSVSSARLRKEKHSMSSMCTSSMKEHAGNDLGFPLLAPLGHLGVDLLAHLVPDLARVARKQREEALHARLELNLGHTPQPSCLGFLSGFSYQTVSRAW